MNSPKHQYCNIKVPLKFNPQSLRQFSVEFQQAIDDPKLRVIVLIGHQDYFSMGMDLDYITENPAPDFINQAQDLFKQIKHAPKAIIAKVENQVIAGGLELLTLVDLIIATDNATFCLPEATFNITPTIVISSLKQRMRATDIQHMVWTCESIDANKALTYGLIDQLTDKHNLDKTIHHWVKKFARISPCVIKNTKQLMQQQSNFDESLALGCQLFEQSINDQTTINTMRRYLEDIRLFNQEYAND